MNIKEEYLSILQAPERRAQAIARIGRDNVSLLLADMVRREYLRTEETPLTCAAGETVFRLTQKGCVFLRAGGVKILPPTLNSEYRLGLEGLAQEITDLEPQLRRGKRLLVTYVDGETETVRYAEGWYAFFEGSSGWREYGGRGSLLRGLLAFLPCIAKLEVVEDVPAK